MGRSRGRRGTSVVGVGQVVVLELTELMVRPLVTLEVVKVLQFLVGIPSLRLLK